MDPWRWICWAGMVCFEVSGVILVEQVYRWMLPLSDADGCSVASRRSNVPLFVFLSHGAADVDACVHLWASIFILFLFSVHQF